MRLCSSKTMREIDKAAIDGGILATELMEKAASMLFDVISGVFSPLAKRRVAIFSGSGNNGGDGIAVARFLREAGCDVRVFLAGDRLKLSFSSAEMERRLVIAGGELEAFDPTRPDIIAFCSRADFIIDALFGIGFRLPLGGDALEACRIMNWAKAPKLSVDIPTGVEADTGLADENAVRADITVTFTRMKPGQVLLPGKLYCGKVFLKEIGIPRDIVDRYDDAADTIDDKFVDSVILPRPTDAHKGTAGKLLVVGGSVGYTGAPVFAAKAAVRSGAGLVFVGVPSSVYPIVAGKALEEMVFPLPDRDGKLSEKAAEEILSRMESCDACVLGPGLGRSADVTKLVSELVQNGKGPLLVDADGINALAENILVLRNRSDVVLTPHDGEFMRLTGGPISGGRMSAARAFAAEHGVTLVLKGSGTVVASPDGHAFVGTTGNPGMAKGGSGDVLSGMVGAFLAAGLSPERAAAAGVHLHGRAGDNAAKAMGEYGMTPSDLLSAIPGVLKKYDAGEYK
ncbi:NAD(P)H-hydrate dehydratase [Oscillospiraceae bacterium OttesenSCG-928-G22]|nr:NAD(P)H-hydrate dehydratase [Oscillospiraceae bacterium OttesenSCG-928-G22]